MAFLIYVVSGSNLEYLVVNIGVNVWYGREGLRAVIWKGYRPRFSSLLSISETSIS